MILRSDGSPVFFLANAVDDAEMEITPRDPGRGPARLDASRARAARGARLHGSGRSSRTFRCSSAPIGPSSRSATVPSRSRTSVTAATSPTRWSTTSRCSVGRPPTDAKCSRATSCVAEFDLDRVTHSAAFFDYKKLDWLNGEYIRALSLDELDGPDLRARVRPLGRPCRSRHRERGCPNRTGTGDDDRRARRPGRVPLRHRRRVRSRPRVDWDEAVAKTERAGGRARRGDRAPRDVRVDGRADRRPPADRRARDQARQGACRCSTPRSKVTASGLPLFDAIYLLGRERTLGRLVAARDRVGSAPEDGAR